MSDDDDRLLDAAHEAHIEEVLDDNTASVHEWLEAKYRLQYKPGRTEVCFEAVLACQEDKAPLPDWLVEALKDEVELALRRSIGWAQLKIAAQEANERRKAEAEQKREWCVAQAEEILKHNPTLNSVSRLAEIIAARAKGTEQGAIMPRGMLAKRSKRGQN